MELQHVNVKIFVDGDFGGEMDTIVKAFHHWTSTQVMDELLIDVADYLHVPDGPGLVLVGHEADYALDHAQGRWGLLYNRKAMVTGSNVDRLQQAFQSAAQAGSLLEQEFPGGELKFSRTEIQIVVNDRGLAPNTTETLAATQADFEKFANGVFGANGYSLEAESESRRRFGVTIQGTQSFEIPAAS